MKTGMLEDTRAVAGYVLAASGKRYGWLMMATTT